MVNTGNCSTRWVHFCGVALKYAPNDLVSSAAVFGNVRQLSPKETAVHIRTRSFPLMFVVCLRAFEQANHITAKCEKRKLSRAKVQSEHQTRSQALSPLPPFVVGRKTLVAAGHETAQNLGGKNICWAGGVAECFDCCCDKLCGFQNLKQ